MKEVQLTGSSSVIPQRDFYDWAASGPMTPQKAALLSEVVYGPNAPETDRFLRGTERPKTVFLPGSSVAVNAQGQSYIKGLLTMAEPVLVSGLAAEIRSTALAQMHDLPVLSTPPMIANHGVQAPLMKDSVTGRELLVHVDRDRSEFYVIERRPKPKAARANASFEPELEEIWRGPGKLNTPSRVLWGQREP